MGGGYRGTRSGQEAGTPGSVPTSSSRRRGWRSAVISLGQALSPRFPAAHPPKESSPAPPPLRPLESFCDCATPTAGRPTSRGADRLRNWAASPLRRAARGALAGSGRPRGRVQREPPPLVHVLRTAARARCGRGATRRRPPAQTRVRPRLPAQEPAQIPAPWPCPSRGPSPLPPPRAPTPGPSLPGARRGRPRSAAPAPRRASSGPLARRARRGWRSAGTQLGPVQEADPSRAQRAVPGSTLSTPRAARAQSGPGRLPDPPPRPIRPRIFPLVGRRGAARQPSSIGRPQGNASCHWASGMSVPAGPPPREWLRPPHLP